MIGIFSALPGFGNNHGRIEKNQRRPVGDSPQPEKRDESAGAHLRLGKAPPRHGGGRFRADHQRRLPAGHRRVRLLPARRALGLRFPDRRDGRLRRGERDHLARRHRLRHQLRHAPPAHLAHGGGSAPPPRRARRRPVPAHSLGRGRRRVRARDEGRVPRGPRAGHGMVPEERVRDGPGPGADRGGGAHERRRRGRGERKGDRARLQADRHPRFGQPLPRGAGGEAGERSQRGAGPRLRPRPAEPGGRHGPLREPRVRPPVGPGLPHEIPFGDGAQISGSGSTTGSSPAPRLRPRRGGPTFPP